MEPLVQKPLQPEVEHEVFKLAPQTGFRRHRSPKSASRWESRIRSTSGGEDDESYENILTARAFSRHFERAWTTQVRSFEAEERLDEYRQSPTIYSETRTRRPVSAPGTYNGGHFPGEKRFGFMPKTQTSATKGVGSRSAVGVQTPVGVNSTASYTPPSHASVQTDAPPRLKGTLHVSGVSAGDVKIAPGTTGTLLRIKTCDQQRQTEAVECKGERPVSSLRAHPFIVPPSFSVRWSFSSPI